MKNHLLLLLPMLILSSCTPEPEAIEYGYDMCHYCKMTIMDQQHAAEAVTDKCKVYKFDAIECMANFAAENKDMSFALLLVNDYMNPKKLIDAHSSHYLISQSLPSPMGAFLTAFDSEKNAKAMQETKGGEIYDWQSLKNHMMEEGLIKYSSNY